MVVSCARIASGSPSGTAITGTVRRSGQPAARAYVRLIKPDGEFATEVWCGPTGSFYLPVPPGAWDLVCLAPHAPRLQQRLTLERGDRFEVTFRLEAA